MKLKKNPKANLEHYSGIFTLLGLVLTLFITYTFLEHKSYAAIKKESDITIKYNTDDTKTIAFKRIKKQPKKLETPILKEPVVEVEKQKKSTKIIDPNHVKKVDNNTKVKETTLIKEEKSVTNSNEDLKNIEYFDDVVEYEPETINYVSVENIPVYPGCEKYMYDREKSKKCFSKKISKFFGKNFDIDLASKLNLVGLQKIDCQFIIDHNGEVSPDIKTTKTHPELEKEIKQVLSDLPKMKPAKQNGKTVNLIYTLPVRFLVE
ncbi:protein TonB [Wenyingzhuangia heitensis]|uniref:Protein TonB n=1 Tax=Wenyingzhuangia heitensis TaxID=1487859 RepID=A0ABX0U5A5_9FLAO|nr:energy transducer TonB [Wenyingzhuangia heitensis]NIJ43992.1 protein TonB [Wenyingzhuangia heitensis]